MNNSCSERTSERRRANRSLHGAGSSVASAKSASFPLALPTPRPSRSSPSPLLFAEDTFSAPPTHSPAMPPKSEHLPPPPSHTY